jgi:hypothetical protein
MTVGRHRRPHAEFSFEHEIDGVRQETRQRAIDYPVAEDAITRGLDCWLAALFDDDHIDHTCELLAGASRLAATGWR